MCWQLIVSKHKASHPKQSFAHIIVHVASRVLRVPLRLVKVHVSTARRTELSHLSNGLRPPKLGRFQILVVHIITIKDPNVFFFF